ncbi:MAG: FAD-dependent oxidoreductase [Coraliomargaritaceae bacterium]
MKTTFILLSALLFLLLGITRANATEEFDLRGYWRMDDGTELLAVDSSGNGNDGRSFSTRWVDGVHHAALQIETGGGVDCGGDKSFNIEEAISIDAWVKPWNPRYPTKPTILHKDGAYALHLGPEKEISFTLWIDGEEQRLSAELGNWGAGQWRYFAATFDGETMKLYINGKLATEKSLGENRVISTSTSPVYIGSVRKRNQLTGTVDEIRVAASVLSEEAIAETFRSGMFDVSRKNNIFTSFYEKAGKRTIEAVVPGTYWVDAEDFDDYGGWWMDTQFVPQMGSPYLIAAGLNKKVENAKTAIQVKQPGKYRLWVRSKNWLGLGHAPGQFSVRVNGVKSETVFGTAEQRAWVWQDGGLFDLEGSTSLELEDNTGFYGRCDAFIITSDLDFIPKQEQKDYAAMRSQFVEPLPAVDQGHFDFIVVGGGVAGCNAAIAAARHGAKVALIQNRPMVGGNNSPEMGVPVSGGSSTGRGREAGLNEEIGRMAAYNFNQKWSVGAELALAAEPNVQVFLNSHVFEAETDDSNRITSVTAFNMIDGHLSRFSGDFFADCTGDGWLGYYAGAEWMLGRESRETFGEDGGKDIADNLTMSGSLMQHSILGYQAIDMGEPVTFDGPKWLYDMRDNEAGYVKRPLFENGIRAGNWWTENHSRNDDLWDPEWARDDLILASMSYYNWIKNYSPLAEKAANYKLHYVPITNAKRETRRLVGELIVDENHLVNREVFPDRVGYFVWMLDVHHPLGIFSPESPFDYERKISPASIPLRCLYSKNIPNMFMAGRNISVSRVALGTARVQGTTGMMGQIIGTAAAICIRENTSPHGIYESHITELQQKLLKDDVTILHLRNEDPNDLARTAAISASSSISEDEGPGNAINGLTRPLDDDWEMWMDTVPSNMWVSDPKESLPQWLELDFGVEREFNHVYLTFDTDLANKRHITWEYKKSDRMPPECVRDYSIQYYNGKDWITATEVKNNYQRRRIHHFPAVKASKVRVLITQTNGDLSGRLYEIRVYNEPVL